MSDAPQIPDGEATDSEREPVESNVAPSDPIPVAIVSESPRRANLSSWMWIATVACLIGAISLTLWSRKPAGIPIVISFDDGRGIQVGNTLQHRGIEVGTVTEVALNSESTKVIVHVELNTNAKPLAKAGAKFWIVRPQFSLTKMSGLDTLVGAKYIGVQPAPADAEPQFEFEGLESPLSLIDDQSIDISIHFQLGNGLQQGDVVRHRGIVVGEVTSVDLSDTLAGVTVRVQLSGAARRLARVGTRFWVERPTISVVEIRGLDTLVGGRYIALQPGTAKAKPQTEFNGLDVAPPADLPEGGLELILEAKQRGALHRGVPVLYRGLRIGHVTNVTLASDAATVEASAWIERPYKHLIRKNTRFWNSGGFDVSVGLSGVRLNADTLSSIIIGGVSLATPDKPGAFVTSGHRFDCAKKVDDEWLEWQPHLPLGLQDVAGDKPLPKPVRATLKWEKRVLGFRTDREKKGWLLPLSNGKILGPANLLMPVANAVDGQQLETEGKSIKITKAIVKPLGKLAVLTPPEPIVAQADMASNKNLVVPAKPTDCLVVTSGVGSNVSLAAARLTAKNSYWEVESSVGLTDYYHGAVVVSRSDGTVVGIVHVAEGHAIVVLVPPNPQAAKPN
jgi:paraquat-inducible protein B